MKVLLNGKIYTEDTRKPWAQAVAIEGKNFVCVGTNEEVIQYAKFNAGEYEIVDLEGKTVLPGLIEGHSHATIISKSSWVIFGEETHDKEELYENIRKAAKKYPKEEKPYFVYSSYCADTFGEEGPRKEVLDEMIPDRPARINDDSGHGCWYNSMALEMLKDENGIPHSVFPIAGQTFFKDEKGEYTGVAFQTVQNGDTGVFKAIGWNPPLSMDDVNSKEILDCYRHCGDIGCMEAALKADEDLAYLSKLDKEDRLYLYFDTTVMLNSCDTIDETIEIARRRQKLYETEHVRVRTVKFFGDGSNEAGDVLSLVPFSNDPEGKNCGDCNFTFEAMRDVLVRLNKERLDLHVHIVCDGTLRRMLDAIEAAQGICGDDWCIKVTLAHLEIMDPKDAKRFKKLGVCADISPQWFGSVSPATQAVLGEERTARSMDFSQFIKDDICYGFSTDNMSPAGNKATSLFIGMEVAVTGIDVGAGIYPKTDLEKYPNGRLPESGKFTVEQCIHAATWNNACRMRIIDKVGSIEVGKRACLTVLNKDIFTIPASEIHTIDPVCTYFDGQELHVPDPLKE